MAERGSVLVTGAAGVIGAHAAAEHASDGWRFPELFDQPAARKVVPPLG
jgi:nucleoside-diphosphate-sugar epimerase